MIDILINIGQILLQVLALILLLIIALVALIYWAVTTPIRKLLRKPYRAYSYYFHPLGGDHYETWSIFSNDH
jgi:hypothetical protein